jgi:hypothetical protein
LRGGSWQAYHWQINTSVMALYEEMKSMKSKNKNEEIEIMGKEIKTNNYQLVPAATFGIY